MLAVLDEDTVDAEDEHREDGINDFFRTIEKPAELECKEGADATASSLTIDADGTFATLFTVKSNTTGDPEAGVVEQRFIVFTADSRLIPAVVSHEMLFKARI